ncbi:MAG: trypsin-like peptidase domain-containing protein [Candidatus Calescibacterium sp.]|nr:trypsin-like peptidase domain-containing protein [Candidatus Calescibacterium sp.]MDW8133100.1 trypsin-like peptidase domain-containing protein [Candidatus Calescibacterium sp.]
MKNIFVMLLLIFCFLIFTFHASLASSGLQKVVEYNKPSVVLMYMDISGKVSFSEPLINQRAFKELEAEITNLAYSGAFGTTEEEVTRNTIRYVLTKMAQNPNKYLIPSKRVRNVDVSTGAVGTGVIINPNGYILTATHVVAMEEDELRQIVINKFLLTIISDELFSAFENEVGVPLSKEDEDLLTKMVVGYISSNIVDFKYEKMIYAGLGVAEKGKSNVTAFFKPANIIKLGSSEKIKDIVDMGRDIAIVKIDQTNLPTSIIADHEPVEGSEITVIGYPAKVHVFAGALFDNFSILKPTITKGIVSAIRTSSKGVRIIQTDATISGGNSGGPAYNNEGKIIGTASWVLVDPNLGIQTQNYGILVSCSEIQNFIKEANIQNVQSEVDKNYQKGIDEYFAQRYRNAIKYFKKVQDLYPEHPYVKEYIINSQTFIDQGKDKSGLNLDLGGNTALILIILGVLFCGGLLFIIAAVGAYFLFFRKKPFAANK